MKKTKGVLFYETPCKWFPFLWYSAGQSVEKHNFYLCAYCVCCSSCGSESQQNAVDSLLCAVIRHAEKTHRLYAQRQYTNPIPLSFYRPKALSNDS